MVRPQDVIARYLGATTIQEQRVAHQLHQNTRAEEVCRIARELGLTLNVGTNSVWQEYWNRSRNFP